MKFLVYLDDCLEFSAAITRLSRMNRQGWLKASNEGLSFIARKGDEFMAEVNFTSPFFKVFHFYNDGAPTFSRVIPYLIRGARNVISVTPSLIKFTKEGNGVLAETHSLMFGNNQCDIIGIDDDEEVTISSLHMTDTDELFDFAAESIYVYEIVSNMAKVVLEMPIGADATVYTYFA